MHRINKQDTAASTLYIQNRTLCFLLLMALPWCQLMAAPQSAMPAKPNKIDMVAVMEVHYHSAIAGHDALIRGDLKTLRRRITELTLQPLPPAAPASWEPFDTQLREAARNMETVTNLNDAALAMASVAKSCGSCHAAAGAGQIYFWPAPPNGDKKIQTAMLTHQWASERLWEGITGPFDKAWIRGAKSLAEGKIFGEGAKATLHARETDLQNLSQQAERITGLDEKALIYGQLLATCAGCHLEANVSIKQDKSVPPWQR
jgi:cytochrome c553